MGSLRKDLGPKMSHLDGTAGIQSARLGNHLPALEGALESKTNGDYPSVKLVALLGTRSLNL